MNEKTNDNKISDTNKDIVLNTESIHNESIENSNDNSIPNETDSPPGEISSDLDLFDENLQKPVLINAINNNNYESGRRLSVIGDPALVHELQESIKDAPKKHQGEAVLNALGEISSENSGIKLRSSLDNQTLAAVLRRGSFTSHSERYINDGYEPPLTQKSVTVSVAVDGRSRSSSIQNIRGSISMAIRRLSLSKEIHELSDSEPHAEEEASPTKIQSEIPIGEQEEVLKVEIEKPQYTLEDEVAKNLEELIMERKEYEIDPESHKATIPKKSTKKTIAKTTFGIGSSLINSVVGAGILSLADTAKKMGIVMYVIWMVLTCIFYFITWKYLNEATYITGAATFRELSCLIFGKVFATIVDVCNIIFFISFLMGYQIISVQYILGIISDFITDREKFDFNMDQCYGNPQRIAGIACNWHFIMLTIVALVLNFPLIMFKNVGFLNKISVISLISATLTTFIVFGKTIYNGVNGLSSNKDEEKNFITAEGKLWPNSVLGFFTMAPFLTSTFQIHACFAPLYAGTTGMSKKTKVKSLHNATYLAIAICTFLYTVIAVSGTLSFDSVSSNILNDFSNEKTPYVDGLIIFCRILMILVVVFSYPALTLPTCASILRWFPRESKFMLHNNGKTALYIVRVCLLIITTVLSMFITNIGSIFSIASAIFSIFVVYITPFSIMMLWPKIKAFGDPSKRKISVVDEYLFNKLPEGDKFFSEEDIAKALRDQENMAKETTNSPIKEEEKIEIASIPIEPQPQPQQQAQPGSLTENVVNDEVNVEPEFENQKTKKEVQKKSVLPPVKISKCRISIFSIAMALSVLYCILSVVGTFVE